MVSKGRVLGAEDGGYTFGGLYSWRHSGRDVNIGVYSFEYEGQLACLHEEL